MMEPDQVRISSPAFVPHTANFVLTLILLIPAGCGGSVVPAATVEPAAAAARALEICDTNGDGALTMDECSSAQGLQTVFSTYDADSDGGLSAQEIELGIMNWSDRPDPIPVEVRVVKGQYAVANATVRLEPVSFLADALPKAEGVTDNQGITRMYASEFPFPESLQRERFMFPGLYNVQVSLPNQTKQPSPIGAAIDSPALASRALKVELLPNGSTRIVPAHK